MFEEVRKNNSMGALLGMGKKKIFMPAHIFEPVTNHEKLTKFFRNIDYLHKAVDTRNKLERFKYVITLFVSNFFYGVNV